MQELRGTEYVSADTSVQSIEDVRKWELIPCDLKPVRAYMRGRGVPRTMLVLSIQTVEYTNCVAGVFYCLTMQHVNPNDDPSDSSSGRLSIYHSQTDRNPLSILGIDQYIVSIRWNGMMRWRLREKVRFKVHSSNRDEHPG